MSYAFDDADNEAGADPEAWISRRNRSGLSLGYFYDENARRTADEILYNGERHLLIFGPNGSGKGTRFLIPNLLRGLGEQSVIVIDPKGELAAITAEHRRKMGHEVVILNPFNVLGLGSAGFNPLANLDPASPTFYDDAAAIGDALIKIEGNDPHWAESAQGLIVGLVMWEKIRNGDQANLENGRQMLTEPYDWLTEKGPDGKENSVLIAGLRKTAREMVARGGFEIESLASRFTVDSKEIAGIQSAADTQTRWLLSKPMREDLRKNGIDFRTLKDRPTTVYVVLPAERLRTHSVWLRLVIVSALRSLYKAGGRRTLMLIDEMAALGHLAPLEDAFGLVRGYRVQIAAIFQDLGQLKQLYKERWETFVANAGVVFGFAPNDLTTAEWMSKRSGQATVVAKGFTNNSGTSTGAQTSTTSGTSSSDQQVARPLFLPHDLIGLEEGMGLLWLAGLSHSTKFFAPSYWKIRACKERAQPNPYYQPD
jgi:type IV secretion system protein VirD4